MFAAAGRRARHVCRRAERISCFQDFQVVRISAWPWTLLRPRLGRRGRTANTTRRRGTPEPARRDVHRRRRGGGGSAGGRADGKGPRGRGVNGVNGGAPYTPGSEWSALLLDLAQVSTPASATSSAGHAPVVYDYAADCVPRCSASTTVADSHFSLAQACAEAPGRTDEALTDDEDRAAPGCRPSTTSHACGGSFAGIMAGCAASRRGVRPPPSAFARSRPRPCLTCAHVSRC